MTYRIRWIIGGVVAVAVLAGGLSLAWFETRSPTAPAGPRVVIIDELSVTDPNPDFVAGTTSLFKERGFSVDYFNGTDVTVGLYKHLASHHYRYILIRSHSYGERSADASTIQLNFVGVFTAEPYSGSKHVTEQRAGQLDEAFFDGASQHYFAINQAFVEAASGRFDNATVILMGCDGMSSDGLARAFVDRGAAAFVSWDRKVTAAHTDVATRRLLGHMLVDGFTVRDAVTTTMNEVGADPAFHGRLAAYP
jgi:hypothetical protein